MDLSAFTRTVTIRGEECSYNPETFQAVMYCENCGVANVVDVFEENGVYSFAGFVCEKCGFWNAPPE